MLLVTWQIKSEQKHWICISAYVAWSSFSYNLLINHVKQWATGHRVVKLPVHSEIWPVPSSLNCILNIKYAVIALSCDILQRLPKGKRSCSIQSSVWAVDLIQADN